jgi:hypothetical protein
MNLAEETGHCKGLQHNDFPFVVAEPDCMAADVRGCEIRRRLAYLWIRRRGDGANEKREYCDGSFRKQGFSYVVMLPAVN